MFLDTNDACYLALKGNVYNCRDEENENDKHCQEYTEGSYSPKLMPMSDLPADAILLDAEDDVKRLEFGRQLVVKTGQAEVSYIRKLLSLNAASCKTSSVSHFSVAGLEC